MNPDLHRSPPNALRTGTLSAYHPALFPFLMNGSVSGKLRKMTIQPDLGIEDFGPYRVHSRREIIALLRAVGNTNQLVRMVYNGGSETIVTSILEVDEDSNSVLIDVAPGQMQNQRIADSENLSFETVLERIRILFFAHHVERTDYNDLPAFRMDIPDSLIRLQRREYYRVPTPLSNPVRCTFPCPGTTARPLSKPATLALKNISNGGIAVIDDLKLLDDTPGAVYENCRIDFPGSPVTVSIEIRNSQEVPLANGKIVRRIGCQFKNLSNQNLSLIQRYILKLEREQNARTTGMA